MRENKFSFFLSLGKFTHYYLSTSSHLPENFVVLFFFIAKQYDIVYICQSLIIHLSAEVCLECLYFLAIGNRTTMEITENTRVEQEAESSKHMPNNGIDESCEISILVFLKTLHSDLQNSYPNLFLPTVTEDSFRFPTTSPALLSFFYMLAILTQIKFHDVLICIFLITKKDKQLLRYFLVILIFLLRTLCLDSQTNF